VRDLNKPRSARVKSAVIIKLFLCVKLQSIHLGYVLVTCNPHGLCDSIIIHSLLCYFRGLITDVFCCYDAMV
jgi:hypothetical protein